MASPDLLNLCLLAKVEGKLIMLPSRQEMVVLTVFQAGQGLSSFFLLFCPFFRGPFVKI